MKVVLIVIAALVTLGLAAVGVVAAQKGTLSSEIGRASCRERVLVTV